MEAKRQATVEYLGATYPLTIYGSCGAGPEGGYNTWAITPDEEGESSGGPRIHAFGDGDSSTLEFYLGLEPGVRLVLEGAEALRFEGNTLKYAGPIAEGTEETISVLIDC